VFLVVTEPGTPGTSKALKIAADAQKRYKKSTVIEMDRSDIANSDVKTRFHVATAKLPLIVVLAPNGAVAGGSLLEYADAKELAEMIPTPKQADVLKATQEGKAVFLVASAMGKFNGDVLSACRDACASMQGNGAVIEVDAESAVERPFLKRLGVKKGMHDTQIVVMNGSGKVTGTFTGVTDASTLATTAAKTAAPCCPPGSGKVCPPAK
jgi:hypothetical protein